jgi:hypothetical protein
MGVLSHDVMARRAPGPVEQARPAALLLTELGVEHQQRAGEGRRRPLQPRQLAARVLGDLGLPGVAVLPARVAESLPIDVRRRGRGHGSAGERRLGHHGRGRRRVRRDAVAVVGEDRDPAQQVQPDRGTLHGTPPLPAGPRDLDPLPLRAGLARGLVEPDRPHQRAAEPRGVRDEVGGAHGRADESHAANVGTPHRRRLTPSGRTTTPTDRRNHA